jgi:hypothetical protein
VSYISENIWDKRVPKDVVARFRPPAACRAPPLAPHEARSAKVRAGRLTDPTHPAFGAQASKRWRTHALTHAVRAAARLLPPGQCGLFAARRLSPGEHVCDYRARTHTCARMSPAR